MIIRLIVALATTLSILACTTTEPTEMKPSVFHEEHKPFAFTQYQDENAEITQQQIHRPSQQVHIAASNEYVYWVKQDVPDAQSINAGVVEAQFIAYNSPDSAASKDEMVLSESNQTTPTFNNQCKPIIIEGARSGLLVTGIDGQPINPEFARLYDCDDTECKPWYIKDGLPLNCQDDDFGMHPDCFGKDDLMCEKRLELSACNADVSCPN